MGSVEWVGSVRYVECIIVLLIIYNVLFMSRQFTSHVTATDKKSFTRVADETAMLE